MSRRITCIQCPMGCVMNVGFAENGEVTSVEGNSCGRGKKYAQAEATNPVRTVCGTVCAAGCLEPVSSRTSVSVFCTSPHASASVIPESFMWL